METIQLKKLISNLYNIDINSLKKLNGYDTENFLVHSKDKLNFILKKYPYSKENLSLVKAENNCLEYLSKYKKSSYPLPIYSTDKDSFIIVKEKNKKYIVRLLSYLDGVFLGEFDPQKKHLELIGSFIGNLTKQLKNYSNDSIASRKWAWDIQNLSLNKKYLKYISNPSDRKLVLFFFQQFEEFVLPKLDELRTSIIHNDLNEWNILVKTNKKIAVIDFGDLAKTQLVNEVAIAMVYASYSKENPLENALIILKSYYEIIKLTDTEISLLYYLMAAKLCISVCNSAYSKKINPKNKYALISENKAWKMLRYLIKTSPEYVENVFRNGLNKKKKKIKKTKDYLKERKKILSPIFSLSYNKPIVFKRSAFQYMFDNEGNSFLDAYNNIPIVGHSHPEVNDAITRQIKKLNTNTRYIYDKLYEYGNRLLKKFPKRLNKIYFVNSGSEASDLAIKIALSHSKNNNVMVVQNGYHGHTQRGTDISHYKYNNERGQGIKSYIKEVPMPDTYRNIYPKSVKNIGKRYAKDASKKINNIAAFITEPILGCGGQVPLPMDYLKIMYNNIRINGGVCISDEVQTGFGRLGKYFWGFEMHKVIPDIVILGKPMGNGHPIGAVITTDDIAKSFGKGVEFFSSFGGNPVSCSAGLAVLDIIEKERLQQNAENVGKYYMKKLNQLKNEFNCIGDVRGSGLFIGIEIVKKHSKKPDTLLAQKLKNKLREKFILVGTDGPHNNVIKSKPPICFTRENVKSICYAIKEILNN